MIADVHQFGETAAWLDALYSRCRPDDGEIVFVDETKRKMVCMGKVGDGRSLVRAAAAMAGRLDHYAKINLMDGDAIRERSKRERKGSWIVGTAGEVKSIVSFHLDCDAGKSSKYHDRATMLSILDRMPRKPSLIANSDGDEGGFHAYWILASPYRIKSEDDRVYVQKLAKRWQNKLIALAGGKLDSTANIDRVLRVVGQRRSNGNLVSCHFYDPSRLYSLRDLALPPDESDTRTKAKQSAQRIIRETLGRCDASDQPVTAYIDHSTVDVESLLLNAGYTQLTGDEWLRPGSESGSRSLKIATENNRPGINIFSANDPNFDCSQEDGSVGRFYSIDEMFVILRHGGSWKAAAAWCHNEIKMSQSRRTATA